VRKNSKKAKGLKRLKGRDFVMVRGLSKKG